jgi:hypothetical protein
MQQSDSKQSGKTWQKNDASEALKKIFFGTSLCSALLTIHG